MALERVRRVGTYAPLSSTYYMDDAIAEAGEAAELLYLRGLAYCASRPEQDGFISRTQVLRFVGVGMTDALERAERLVEVDLWEAVDGGYLVRSWLKWNKSAEELGRYRARDRERKRKAGERSTKAPADEDAESEEPSDTGSDSASARNPRGRRADSDTSSDTHSTTHHFNTRKEHPPSPPPGGIENLSDPDSVKPSPRGRDYDDPLFARFWDAYPRKTGKPSAWKAWKAALKRGANPEAIIQAALAYRDDPRRKPDYTKHPGPWLNDERYNDQPLANAMPSEPTGSWWDN